MFSHTYILYINTVGLRKNVENVRFERLSKVPNFMCYRYTTFSIILQYVKEPKNCQAGGVRTHARQHLCAVTGFQDQQLQPTRSLPEMSKNKKQKTPLDMNGVSSNLKILLKNLTLISQFLQTPPYIVSFLSLI